MIQLGEMLLYYIRCYKNDASLKNHTPEGRAPLGVEKECINFGVTKIEKKNAVKLKDGHVSSQGMYFLRLSVFQVWPDSSPESSMRWKEPSLFEAPAMNGPFHFGRSFPSGSVFSKTRSPGLMLFLIVVRSAQDFVSL